ncbi:PTS system trehalose-specific EIIBC component [Paenibacillus dendritiformis]|uniref:PTS system trehalose-specific EIIBC component n=1 Tax=Paenibacillus dendritiformis TaxID=130049 RepID=UPI00248C827F|nr:PTS system trehalose-specific EIIBC component [Paenibacillus dendritiformis]WGU94473.1 PTS system trehalose-specific EIIBC component [Paenibacillus dendritiformis]
MAIKRKSVEQIIEAVGGSDNISDVIHCITRLRFSLRDEGKVNKEALDKNDLVKGSFSTNGQFQVVIGQGLVDKVHKELVQIAGMAETSTPAPAQGTAPPVGEAKKINPLQRFVKVLGDIFIPLLPAIVTSGLLLGLNNLLVGPGIFYAEKSLIEVYPAWEGFADIVSLIASTAFTFLPGLIGWSAVKRFGGSPLLGIVLGLMLIHPSLSPASDALSSGDIPRWDLFGLSINKIGYQGQVIPVLLSSFLLARIELLLRKRIPDSIQLLLVAPIALLVTGFITFAVIGPVTFHIGNAISDAVVAMFHHFGWLAGFIYAGIGALLVMTGMHHTFLALDLQLISSIGTTYLWPVIVMSNIAQGAAALAMMFASKDDKLRGTALTSGISAFLGVTEPAMFGVNIRFKFPFISAMIGAACAGMLVAWKHVTASSIGIGGIPAFLSIFTDFWGIYFIAMGIAVAVPFVLTLLFAKVKGTGK